MAAKKVKVGINNEDRISSLSDGVLCHILSFLPTKNSVNTRILSTRWTHLFKFVPILDFEYGRNRSDPDSPVNTATNFIQFVNSVFILYKVSSMCKFRFYFSDSQQDPDNYPIFSWLSSAIDRSVQQINICITFGVPWTLPRDLFSCKTLTNLVLQGSFRIVLPSSVCLPCLKTCSLIRVVFKDESARKLFRACPVLEKLRLNSCDMREGVEVLDISVPTLKHFFIHACDDFQIVLNVPNLTYFEYVAEGPTSNEFLGLETLRSLVEAIIYYEQESDITDNVSIELVWGISHVQELCLYCGPMEAFLRSGHSLPTFNNLTRLILGPMSSLSSQLLSDLLDKSPRLEFISFNQRYGDELDGADQNNYVLPEHVPTCVSLHLKEVVFRYFSMVEYECKLIKYFLKNAKKLKKMQIQSNLAWDEQFEIGSEICQVVFDSDGVEED